MQIIRLGETAAAKTAIQFTSVLASNVQSRILAATLANTAIVVKSKRAGTQAVVTLSSVSGNWTAADDTGAPGVREYLPTAAELVEGFQTLIFTGTNMEPREVPICVVKEDPFKPAYYGAAVTGTLAVGSITTSLTPTNVDQFKNAFLTFVTGNAAGCPAKIASCTTGGLFTFATGYALPVAPANADVFRIITA